MTQANPHAMRPFVLLVGLDLGPASGYALDQAARISLRVPASELHVLHVIHSDATAARARNIAGQLRNYVEEKAKAFGGMEGQSVAIHVRVGDPAREIAQLAKDVSADLIVLGAEKRFLKALGIGSVATRALEDADCPVVVAGPPPTRREHHRPSIEPPCPDCLDVRTVTHGKTWWCTRHSETHVRAHAYSHQSELPFAGPDVEVDPRSIR